MPEPHALQLLERAIERISQPAIDAYAAKLRKWSSGDRGRSPRRDGSPAAALRVADAQLRAALTSMGASTGAVAAAPGVGTGVALALAAGETGTALGVTATYALACARIHGVDISDIERRRTLVFGIALGDGGHRAGRGLAQKLGPAWAKRLVDKVDAHALRRINALLVRNFITKYGEKQGVVVLGKVVPFGVGALVGAGANLLTAEGVIRAARHAFGQPPEQWPDALASAPDADEDDLTRGPDGADPVVGDV